MSQEKQIEEMADIIYSKINGANFNDVSDAVVALYDAGYRKQIEGKWEIVIGSNGREKMVCTNCRHQQDLEEMADIIYSKINGANFDDVSDAVVALYDAGYRKQIEGKWEIVIGSNGREKMVCTNCGAKINGRITYE